MLLAKSGNFLVPVCVAAYLIGFASFWSFIGSCQLYGILFYLLFMMCLSGNGCLRYVFMCAFLWFWIFSWSVFLNDILCLDTFHSLVFYFCTASLFTCSISTFYGESWTRKMKVILHYFCKLLMLFFFFLYFAAWSPTWQKDSSSGSTCSLLCCTLL